jgi:ankyrin repeat protein
MDISPEMVVTTEEPYHEGVVTMEHKLAIMSLIHENDIQGVRKLLHVNVNLLGVEVKYGKMLMTPIHYAIWLTATNIIDIILEANSFYCGDCLKAIDNKGRTPLHIAVLLGYNFSRFFEHIPNKGKSYVDACDEMWRTPLFYAVARLNGHFHTNPNDINSREDMNAHDSVQLLLSYGANPDTQSVCGVSSMFTNIRVREEAIIDRILEMRMKDKR